MEMTIMIDPPPELTRVFDTGLIIHSTRMGRCQVWVRGEIISIWPSQLAAKVALEAELGRHHHNPAL